MQICVTLSCDAVFGFGGDFNKDGKTVSIFLDLF